MTEGGMEIDRFSTFPASLKQEGIPLHILRTNISIHIDIKRNNTYSTST